MGIRRQPSYFQSIWLIPPSLGILSIFNSMWDITIFFYTLFRRVWESETTKRDSIQRQLATDFMRVLLDTNGKRMWPLRALILMSLYYDFNIFGDPLTSDRELLKRFPFVCLSSCSRVCKSSWRWGGSRWRERCTPLRRMGYWLWIRLWSNRLGKGSQIGWEKQKVVLHLSIIWIWIFTVCRFCSCHTSAHSVSSKLCSLF